MSKLLGNISRSLIAMLLLGSVSMAAQTEYIDATHMFEQEVKSVVSSVELITRKELAKIHKSAEPQRKTYKVGDVETFWTKNIVTNAFEQTPAVLKSIGRHCYVFLEEGKSISGEAIDKVQKNFDDNIYPTNTRNFGSEWKPGIDGDERITLLMFDIKDGYSGTGGFVGGYFYAVDSYLQEKLPAHVKSNEREMFYLDINPSDPVSDRYMNTIAHEFQHMIHFNNDSSEYSWVNEACSQIAPYLCGYGHANQVGAYMRTPDNSLTAWAKEQMLANYGQVYLWNYFIFNSFLREDAETRATFFRNLVASKKTGIAGYAEALATVSKTFTSTFDKFAIANFINDPRLASGEYAYDKTMGRLKLPVSETVFALPAQVYGEVFLWSADAIKVDLTNAREVVEIDFTGFRGTMGVDLTNTFSVALIMSNSRGNVDPKISFLSFTIDSGKVQGGKMSAKIEKDYDTAMVVVIAQAPEEVDDRMYVKAQPMTYEIKIKDAGAALPRVRTQIDLRATLTSYAQIASALDLSSEGAAMIALGQLEAARVEITNELAAQLENADCTGIDTIADMLASGEISSTVIKPLLNDMSTTAEFYAANKNLPMLREKINSLKNL